MQTSSIRILFASIICAGLAPICTPSLMAAPFYSITDLGALSGSAPFGFSNGLGVNNSGQVAGLSATADFSPHGFFWTGGIMKDVGTLGGLTSSANAVNNLGRVTGAADTAGGGTAVAYIYDGLATSPTLQSLGTLGGAFSIGYGINDAGQVAGHSATSVAGSEHAFRWSNGAMQDLGTLGGAVSIGYAINASGQVAGLSEVTSGGARHAFFWNGASPDMGMQDIGTLGGTFSQGRAINNTGQIAGSSNTAGGAEHAFLWNGTSMQDLGTLGGAVSRANGVNSAGQVVGTATAASSGFRAFLWDGSAMLDLNSILANGAGWQLVTAAAISNTGFITGTGSINGQNHAFLLIPLAASVPEPASWMMMATLAMLMAVGLSVTKLLARKAR